MFGLEDGWSAYCLDSAAATLGVAIDNALSEVKGKTDRDRERNREAILRRFIPQQAKARKFKDPGKR